MNLSDPSLLSAYLDGELNSRQLAQVEQALAASPELRAELDGLRRVRDGLASLARPALPQEWRLQLVENVQQATAGHELASPRLGSVRLFAGLGALAAAAALLAALGFGLSLRPAPDRNPIVAITPIRDTPPPAPTPASPAPEPASSVVASFEPVGPPVLPTADPAPAPTPAPIAVDATRIASLLDNPNTRRFDLELRGSETDAALLDDLDELVRTAALAAPDFGRIEVGHAVVVDPARPGAAVVYAFAADPAELDLLLSRLRRDFSDRVVIQSIDQPAHPVTTLLANAGQAELRTGSPASTFQPRLEITALRGDGDTSSPTASSARPQTPGPILPAVAQRTTILLWVRLRDPHPG